VKRIYRILTYLIFFVILPTCSLYAIDVFNLLEISGGFHFLKDPRFASAYQPGYEVAEGIELSPAPGLHIGLVGAVSITEPSEINLGVIYRGYVAVGGKLHAGYIQPRISFSPVTLGILGALQAEYARYFDTDLLFFFMSAAVQPVVSIPIAHNVGVRFGLPIRYCFRGDLSFHIYTGITAAFLIG
jgi:hypothetical protein